MAPRPLEYCCECDAPTGRAGQGEDSLYTDSGDLGPYCEDCWGDVEFWRGWADKLLGQNDRLRAAVIAFMKAKASIAGDSYDGVDDHTRYLLDHADAQAGLALGSVKDTGEADDR